MIAMGMECVTWGSAIAMAITSDLIAPTILPL